MYVLSRRGQGRPESATRIRRAVPRAAFGPDACEETPVRNDSAPMSNSTANHGEQTRDLVAHKQAHKDTHETNTLAENSTNLFETSLPMINKVSRNPPMIGRVWLTPNADSAETVQSWPGTTKLWPKWALIWPESAKFGRAWPKFGPNQPGFGRNRQHLAGHGPKLANIGKMWSIVVRTCSSATEVELTHLRVPRPPEAPKCWARHRTSRAHGASHAPTEWVRSQRGGPTAARADQPIKASTSAESRHGGRVRPASGAWQADVRDTTAAEHDAVRDLLHHGTRNIGPQARRACVASMLRTPTDMLEHDQGYLSGWPYAPTGQRDVKDRPCSGFGPSRCWSTSCSVLGQFHADSRIHEAG